MSYDFTNALYFDTHTHSVTHCAALVPISNNYTTIPHCHNHQFIGLIIGECILFFFAGAMDTFARGLLAAHKLLDDGVLPELVKEHYSSYDSGIGAKIENGTTNFEELEVLELL